MFHENKGRYGYRRITAELRKRGIPTIRPSRNC
ncbi:IS3 family transposase [Yeguia hominis]